MLEKACEALVTEGNAENVLGSAIRLAPPDQAGQDQVKQRYADLDRRYGEYFNRLYAEHKEDELAAEKRLQDFVIRF
jgi:hypothetical protein